MSDAIRSEDGFLVLADISGYTRFVSATELEHGAQVTGVLLEAVMDKLAPPLEIQELEGDAVFAVGADRRLPEPGRLPELFDGAFTAFKDRQARLATDDSCDCRACRGVLGLDLKLVVHHGRFVRQHVGGRERLAGADVVLAHRLLKNSVEARAYALLTEPALQRIGVDPVAAGMQAHVASYAHLGEVPCYIAPLEAAAAEREPAGAAGGRAEEVVLSL